VSSVPAAPIYRVNDLELDTVRGCLRRHGEEIHLKPKAFQILVYLLENRERLVSREELMEQFWKDAAVTDDALAQAIAELRRALGDNPRNPLYLKTLPKRGYRFVAGVEEVRPEAVVATVNVSEQITTVQVSEEFSIEGFPVRRRWLLAAALLLVLVPLVLWWRARPSLPPPVAGKRQIAVFTFENRSGRPDLNWLSDGLPDMLTTTLSRSSGLDVLSREQLSVWLGRIGDRGLKGVIELARRSHAQLGILGSFASVGPSIRIDARIYDGRGSLIAAEAITVDQPDRILGQVDFLAARLAGRLSPNRPTENQGGLSSIMTDNLEAYRYYSLGLQQADAFHTREAIELFEKALALDPNFAMAYARIGFTYVVPGGNPDPARPYLEKAFQLSARLTEKDRRHILAWYAIANKDYKEAIQRYRDLIRAYPNEAEPYLRLSRLLGGESRNEEAIEALHQGLAIDPEDPQLYNGLSGATSMAGRHEEAVRLAERYVALAGNANSYDTLGLALRTAGSYEQSLAAFNKALQMEPDFEIARIHRAALYLQTGRERDCLRECAERAVTARTPDNQGRYWETAAWLHWRRGRMNEARAAMMTLHRMWPDILNWNPAELTLSPARRALSPVKTPIPGRGGRFGLRAQFYYLAQEARLHHRPGEMLADLREALRDPPDWGMVEPLEDSLADAYVELGRVDDAIAEYQRALQLYPGMALARYHLAQAYRRKGDNAAAKAQFARFLEIWKQADPDLPEVVDARRSVQ